MLSIVIYGVLFLAVGFAGFALWVRLAPTDPTYWHVDPVAAPDPDRPNFARVDQTTRLSAAQAAAAIVLQAESEGAERIAGDARFGTWIARTPIMRYPDFISIRVTPEGDGARIMAFARARFGRSDLGVNQARLRRWIGGLPD